MNAPTTPLAQRVSRAEALALANACVGRLHPVSVDLMRIKGIASDELEEDDVSPETAEEVRKAGPLGRYQVMIDSTPEKPGGIHGLAGVATRVLFGSDLFGDGDPVLSSVEAVARIQFGRTSGTEDPTVDESEAFCLLYGAHVAWPMLRGWVQQTVTMMGLDFQPLPLLTLPDFAHMAGFRDPASAPSEQP